MGIFDKIWNWIDKKGHISDIPLKAMPDYTLNITYWIGGLLAAAFFYQALTGMVLMLYYIPGQDSAYKSTEYIMNSVPFGNLLLTSHQYMAYAMIFLVFVHFFRNYFIGAYKKGRELTWIVGVLMSVVVILMGFTGYFLPYTEISVDATDVGIGMAKFIPFIGSFLAGLISGNGTLSSEFSRILDFHVLILPAILLLLLGVHMYLYEKNEAVPPLDLNHKVVSKRRIKWFPVFFAYSLAIGFLLYGVVIILSAIFPLTLPPEAGSGIPIIPMPEWYLAPYYKIVDFEPISTNVIYLMLLIVIFLIIIPFLDRKESRDPRDRPFFTAIGITLMQYLILYTAWAYIQPGVEVQPIIWAPISFGIPVYNITFAIILYKKYRRGVKIE